MKFKCVNSIEENGRVYWFGDIISEKQFKVVSERNRKWFIAIPDIEEPKKVDPEIIGM